MLFYVKDRKTFKTKAVLEGISWKLVRSVWTDLSEIVAKDDPNVVAGDIIFNRDGWLGLITDLERDEKKLSLKIEKIERLFQRKMIWEGFGTQWPCDHTLYHAFNNYIRGAQVTALSPKPTDDPVYALPFVTVSRLTLDAGPSFPLLDNAMISLTSYISQVRRLQNVYTTFTINGDNTMTASIEHKTQTTKTLITTNYPCIVKEESFSETKIAKVTSFIYESNSGSYIPTTLDIQDYYLMSDGSITQDPSSGTRAEGEWVMVTRMDEDDPLVVAQNEFAKNKYSHKLIIQMQEKDAIYDFYDRVNVEVGKHMYESYVSRKTVTSDGLVEYTFGDLKTSLMDKINEYD